MEHEEGDERPPATPASLLAAHHVPARANATPQDTPHYFADTREIYGTVQVATGSERCAGAATWQPLAVSVQSRKVGELSDEPGPPWTAAAQPAVQSAALAESVVDQYENDGARTPQPVTVQTTTAVPKDYRDGRPISKLAFALPPMCREVRIRPAKSPPIRALLFGTCRRIGRPSEAARRARPRSVQP